MEGVVQFPYRAEVMVARGIRICAEKAERNGEV